MNKKIFGAGFGMVLAAASIVLSVGMTNADTVASPICSAFNRSLSFGVSGNDVAALQTYLNAQGYLNVSSTGYFGILTRGAVAQWQAKGGVAAAGASGSGIFGPLSRAYFLRSCSSGSGNTASGTISFSSTPASGIAPLTVQFNANAPQGTSFGNAVNFGDGMSGSLLFVPTCSSCNAMGVVSHTYTVPGTYTATLTSGTCECFAAGPCNCPNMMIVASTTVIVIASSSANSSSTAIQQLNAPGSVTLGTAGIAEIRNENFYFTLASVTGSAATIDITPVGCWNSFPSDPAPIVRCMIAVIPTPPQTLSIGQKYTFGNYGITLVGTSSGTASFSIQ